MKRNIFIIMMCVVCIMCVALVSAEQAVPQKPVAGETVGSGCVGECGATAKIEYTVDARDNVLMVVKTVETGLCTDTGACAFLFKNGKEAAYGHITKNGASIQTKAAPGDKIVAYSMTYPLFTGVVCISLGNLKFDLIKKNLLKKK